MEEITLRSLLKDTKGLSFKAKAAIFKIYILEKVHNAKPYIAVTLWIILFYLLHINDIYTPKASDFISIVGIAAAVAALAIAESQLTSWKQEKILDRLEELLIASVRLRKLCNTFEHNPPLDHNGSPRIFQIKDDDIFVSASLMRNGSLDRESIIEETSKIMHQITFLKKLIGKNSFKLNTSKEAKKFLNDVSIYVVSLEPVLSSAHDINLETQGILKIHTQEGYYSKILNDHYSTWKLLNKGSLDVSTPASELLPPSYLIEMRVRALITTLRI